MLEEKVVILNVISWKYSIYKCGLTCQLVSVNRSIYITFLNSCKERIIVRAYFLKILCMPSSLNVLSKSLTVFCILILLNLCIGLQRIFVAFLLKFCCYWTLNSTKRDRFMESSFKYRYICIHVYVFTGKSLIEWIPLPLQKLHGNISRVYMYCNRLF